MNSAVLQKAIVKSWRRRQYFYTSTSVFRTVGAELKVWLQPQRDGELDEAERKKRVKALFRVTDYDGMYKMVGDALVSFIAEKTAPFPGDSIAGKFSVCGCVEERVTIHQLSQARDRNSCK